MIKNLEDYSIENFIEYLRKDMRYGWIDIFNEIHISTLKNIYSDYKINKEEQTNEYGIGTCIEQSLFIKRWCEENNYEHNIYCLRDNIWILHENDRVFFHVFVTFKKDDRWYHIENIVKEKRGIASSEYEQDLIDLNLENYSSSNFREIIKLEEIPTGITLKEFDEYIDNIINNNENCRKKI